MDKIIIKACLNGGRGREQSPQVPWTPEEVAAEATRCADAEEVAAEATRCADAGAAINIPIQAYW